jgi:hypothetical protein
VAVSKDETPVSDWYKTFIDTAETIDGSRTVLDTPSLEVDEEAVYVAGNMYLTLLP